MVIPEGWSLGQLADGIELISGQHIEANLCSNDPNGMPYLTGPSDFPDGKIIVTKYTSSPKVCCKAGDILITVKGSGTGKIVVSDADYCISRQLMAVRAERFDSGFVFQFLSTKLVEFSEASTGLIPGISRSDVTEKPLNIPPLEEQVKIAEVLTTWDDALETLGKLIAAKLELKRGLMQALLTGKKRFQEFETRGDVANSSRSAGNTIPRDWKKVKLGGVVEKVGSGITPKGGSTVYLETGIPLIRSQNVLWGKLDLSDVAFISNEQHQKMRSTKLKTQDVLLNITGASIGRSCVFPDGIDEANVNQHVCIIRTQQKELTALFLSSYLNSEFGQNQIDLFQGGGNRQGLNFEQIRAFPLPLPPLEEQIRIAEVLTTLDTELEGLRGQLERVKTQKKGLMQQLLTGKVRVKVTG
jgi:type I restriction enzyme, S subunit